MHTQSFAQPKPLQMKVAIVIAHRQTLELSYYKSSQHEVCKICAGKNNSLIITRHDFPQSALIKTKINCSSLFSKGASCLKRQATS